MADNDLEIKFGADVAGLTAGASQAKSEIDRLVQAIALLQKTVGAAARVMTSELTGALQGVGAGAATASTRVKAHGEALENAGKSGHRGASEMSFFTLELRALADEAMSGRWRNFEGSLTRIIGHSAGMIASFVAANPVFSAFTAAAAAAAGAIGYLGLQEIAAGNAVQAIRLDAAAGQMQLTRAEAEKLRAEIVAIANVSSASAEDIYKPFLALGSAGEYAAKLVAQYVVLTQGEKKTGEAADEMAKYFSDLGGKGRELVASTNGVTVGQMQAYDSFVASGRQGSAMAMVYDALRARYEALRQATLLENAAVKDSVPSLEEALSGVLSMDRGEQTLSQHVADATAQIQRQSDVARENRAAMEAAANAQANYAAAARVAMQVDREGAEIKKKTSEIATLQAGLAAAKPDDAAGIAAFNRSIGIAQDELKQLQERASDGLLGRDASQKLAEQNRLLADTYKGSAVGLLTKQRANAQGVADDPNASAKERQAAEMEVADKTKEIRAAEYADFQAAENIKVAAAGKNSAAVIAIRQEEAAKARETFGAGSNEERAAIEQVARAKEQAANRGAAAATKAAKDELGATEEGIKGQIKALEDATKATLEHLNAEVKLKQVTQAQATAITIAELAKEKAAVDALYAQEAALAGLSLTKKKAIADQEVAFNDEIALKTQEAQEKAAEATQKSWDSAFKEINSAFDAQVNGLLRGTTSWSQAFKNVLASLTEDMIKFFLNWGLQQAEKTAMALTLNNSEVAAHVAGDATKAAADASANSAGIGGMIANAIHAITIDAGQASAGVTAFLAPILGPAAPAAGAAAGSSVLAMAAFDIGAWNIPQDQLAMIHRNELVMPAAEAGAFRSMLTGAASGEGGGGGGGSVSLNPSTHFHVSAVDGASVASFFRNNSREMMKAVNNAVRQGAHLGLRRLSPT